MQEDKRRFTRIHMDARVRIEAEGLAPLEGQLIDVSVRGMQVHFPNQVALPEVVRFDIILGEGEPDVCIEGMAKVVRSDEVGDFGLFLMSIDIDSLTHLRRLVELNLGNSGQAVDEIVKW